MIPQIQMSTNIKNIEYISYGNKTYRYSDRNLIGYVDELDALKQSVSHILNTERYSQAIYDDSYGVELEQYIGKPIDFIRATIEDTLKEALLQDDRILDVIVTNITSDKIDSCNINFNVITNIGIIESGVNVNL